MEQSHVSNKETASGTKLFQGGVRTNQNEQANPSIRLGYIEDSFNVPIRTKFPQKSQPLYPFVDEAGSVSTDASKHPLAEIGKQTHELDAVVVGASWAGIWALYRLQGLGIRVKLLDACREVGGVWWYSRYPGCRVDTEIPFYEFSDPELWQKWNWSERFPSNAEIKMYLSWVCTELDIRKNMIFDTKVVRSIWDDENSKWNLYTADGEQFKCQFFCPTTGYSTIRHIPKIKGLDKFEEKYHTTEWPPELDCTGKRVAIIGTGASGVQVIEALSKHVSHLSVFQRTPNLATPMQQIEYSESEMTEFKHLEYSRRLAGRNSRNGFHLHSSRRCRDDTPTQRGEFFETLWTQGGLAFWFGNYSDLFEDPIANICAYNFWRSKVRKRIIDPEVAEKLAPIKPPHAFGTKRPSLETAYFEAFNQPNVDLIDVNSEPITEITAKGIHTSSGRFHKVDVLALATGFDSMTGSMLAMGIEGRQGIPLNQKWNLRPGSEGVSTYLGIMTAGFPNMFFPMGPQGPSALGLTPYLAELQGDWVAKTVAHVIRNKCRAVEPTIEAEEAWKLENDRAAHESLFGQTDSWYMGVNIPGRMKQPLVYFGGVNTYRSKLSESVDNGFADLSIT